jgi:hypothetical protein
VKLRFPIANIGDFGDSGNSMNSFFTIASDLGRTVAQAKPLLMKLDNADTSTRPAEGKWAKKEILGHLLDSASNNHQRFVRAALQGSLTFPG